MVICRKPAFSLGLDNTGAQVIAAWGGQRMKGDYLISYWSSKSWVAWWLEHRTPDKKAWVRSPMPPNTLQVHTKYVHVKAVGPKVLWAESRTQGTGEYFPPLQFHGKIVEMEIGGVAIYRSFGKFHLANLYCHLYGVQGQ
ncbi:uncharacterized protein TNCV_2067831 [Trichonephila clavipes]|uniref:Uncharacterized protein n=1 Tax=Trichonephila clavipes TaxID=2585209 RepID=A0A8X6W342_TRICX|nr:uncharacterized protein TNCV_2067831 [Trichonephila clavipes]